MSHYFVQKSSLPEAYHTALSVLHHCGQIVNCSDYQSVCKEISLTMNVLDPLKEPRISRCFIGGHHELQQYVMEVCYGILDFMIGQGDHVWEYTYHDRISKQIFFVIDELRRNPDSRRAVIDVRDNSVDMFNEHPACLQHMQFMIRDGKLNLQIVMRSNDAAEATFMNAFAFVSLQERVAKNLNVPVGTYTHTANSFHVYKKDFDLLEHFVDRIERGDDTTFIYKGMYEQLMKDEIPSIEEMVEQQKKKYLTNNKE